MSPPGWKTSTMLLGKSRGQLLIAPERMRQLGQRRVVKVKYKAVKKYSIGTWNVRSMNQGKLDMVKQEMERVSINILGISKLNWTWYLHCPAKSLQPYPTLCDPMDCSPSGSSVHGILQTRILEWGNTCMPVADSCWCMTKPIQYCKVINLQLK